MKKIILVAMVIIGFLVGQACAASEEDVTNVINLLKSADKTKKFLAYKDQEGKSFQRVYVIGEKRYTVHYAPDLDGGQLSFWVRPNGTKNAEVLDVLTDRGFDGSVDFAQAGLNESEVFDRELKINLSSQKYWQSQYDQAIADAIQYLK